MRCICDRLQARKAFTEGEREREERMKRIKSDSRRFLSSGPSYPVSFSSSSSSSRSSSSRSSSSSSSTSLSSLSSPSRTGFSSDRLMMERLRERRRSAASRLLRLLVSPSANSTRRSPRGNTEADTLLSLRPAAPVPPAPATLAPLPSDAISSRKLLTGSATTPTGEPQTGPWRWE